MGLILRDKAEWQDDDLPTTADIRARVAAGMTDQEIRVELGLSEVAFDKLRRDTITEELVTVKNRPAELIYSEYRIRMNRIANDLHDVSIEGRADKGKNLQAAMGALKAEAAVINQMITTGQELGVLPRAPKSTNHTVIGGFILGAMTDNELHDVQKGMKSDRSRLKKQYGDTPFLDLPEGDIYEDAIEGEVVEVQDSPAAPTRKPRR